MKTVCWKFSKNSVKIDFHQPKMSNLFPTIPPFSQNHNLYELGIYLISFNRMLHAKKEEVL